MIRLTTILLCLSMSALAGSQSAPKPAGTEVTVHCPGKCKVYLDGQLVANMSEDGVKLVRVSSHGVAHTFLITRPGLRSRTYTVKGDSPLLIEADESEPRAIEPSASESSHAAPDRQSGPSSVEPTMNASQPNFPAWAAGLWQGPNPEWRKFTLTTGSVSCPAEVLYGASVDFDNTRAPWFSFSQSTDVDTDDLNSNDPRFDTCLDLMKQSLDWKIDVDSAPIKIISAGSDALTFSIDLDHCKKCIGSALLRNVTWHFVRAGLGTKLQWDDGSGKSKELSLSR